jgi:HPt (histidine-containing phosphotransfer) domain-containing protein
MDDCLAKPVRLDQLQATLAKRLPLMQPSAPTDAAPARPANNPLAVLDQTVLPMFVGSDPARLAEFQQLYLQSAYQIAEEIRAALTGCDWQAVGDHAHKLKSPSRSVGALALGEACERLEEAGYATDGEAVQTLALEFEAALSALLDALHQGTT